MLKHLQKIFNAGKTATQEEVVMAQDQVQADLSVVTNTAEMSALVAQLASQSETLLSIQSQFAELTSKYETAQAALSEIEAAKAALVAEAKSAKLSARKEKIVLTVGTDKADALLTATENLEDAQFEAVVAAMASSFEAEAKSKLFVEAGVAAEMEVVEEDAVSKLAAKINKQFKSK